jgi:hypothetical protein
MSMRYLLLVLLLARLAGATDSSIGILSPTTSMPSTVSGSFGAANVLFCVDWVPMLGIANATKLAWKITGGSTTSGVAVYAVGGTQELAEGTTTGTGLQTVTGLTPFSLTAGGLYRTCQCSTGGSSFAGAAIQLSTGFATNPVVALFNTFGNHMGNAANPCVAGNPPSITGPLTPADGVAIGLYIAKE